MEDDPFRSLSELCQCSDSQEARLRRRPFALQSQETHGDYSTDYGVYSPDDGDLPVASTGIVMVSLPESLEDQVDTPNDDFHTPPEDALLASSDEQRSTAVDRATDQKIEAVQGNVIGSVDVGRAVDLGSDSEQTLSEVESAQGIGGVHFNEGSDRGMQKARVLKRAAHSEDGVSAKSPLKKVKVSYKKLRLESSNANVGTVSGQGSYVSKSVKIVERNEAELFEANDGQGLRKKMTGSSVPFDFEDGGVLGPHKDTVKLDSLVEKTEEAAQDVVSVGNRCETDKSDCNGGDSSAKNIDDIEKLKYVCRPGSIDLHSAFKGVKARHKLPSSICGKAENAERESGPGLSKLKKAAKGIAEIVESKLVDGGGAHGVDVGTLKLNSLVEAAGHAMSNGNGCEVDEFHENVEGHSCNENGDDVEKRKYVCSSANDKCATSKGVGGRRELPSSICGLVEKAELKKLVKSIQDVLMCVSERRAGDSLANVDMLDIVKSRGMTFPPPRWWRPGGYGQPELD